MVDVPFGDIVDGGSGMREVIKDEDAGELLTLYGFRGRYEPLSSRSSSELVRSMKSGCDLRIAFVSVQLTEDLLETKEDA